MAHPIFRLLRPRQWIKNGFVFAPLVFAGQFEETGAWLIACIAALSFVSISCVVYIVNDMRDMGEDRLHPVKRLRPLAAGEITLLQAGLAACFFAAVAAYFLILLPLPCMMVALIYIGLNGIYTMFLKRIAIVDVFFIAFCYVLRVLMGGYALEVTISPWIILATFLLALFLAFGKRYHEVGHEEYAKLKPNLRCYNHNLLDRLLTITGASALMTYAIYAAEVAERIHKMEMIYTVGFVAFGLFRYLQMIYVHGQGGEPEAILFKDKLQQLNIVLWLAVTLWIMF